MKVRRRCFSAATVLVGLLGLAPPVPGQEADVAADVDPGADTADVVEVPAGPVIQTPGFGLSTIHVVDHGDSWSMHAENVPTNLLFGLWQTAGGPEMVAKTFVDRPYTLSVHRLSPERIVERLLDGYDYTLHYDGGGRLVRVRVYSLDPGSVFKTPRLVESLRAWTDKETPAVSGSEKETPAVSGSEDLTPAGPERDGMTSGGNAAE